jgi:S1-C subfamily serine protease
VVTSTGAVVTNYHVVDHPSRDTILVMTADQHVFPVEAILAASRAGDLAIMKISAEGLRPLPVATTPAAAPVGSPISVVSHPDGRFYSYTTGIVSRYMKVHSDGQDVDAVSITADYARGSSGAPVLNPQGHVVAIVMSTESVYYNQSGNEQRNLQMVFKTCIPSRSLLKLIEPYSQITSSHGAAADGMVARANGT